MKKNFLFLIISILLFFLSFFHIYNVLKIDAKNPVNSYDWISDAGKKSNPEFSLINSDTMLFFDIYQDVFQKSFSLSDWLWPPAPAFFPDVMLVFGIMAFLKEPFFSFFVYICFIFIILVFLFSFFIYRLIYSKNFTLIISFFFLFFAFLIFSCFKDFHTMLGQAFYWFYHPGSHMGNYINTLLALIIIFLFVEKKKITYLIIFFLLIFLSVISDKLFVVSFSLPFFISFLFFHLFFQQKFGFEKYQLFFFLGIFLLTNFLGWQIGDHHSIRMLESDLSSQNLWDKFKPFFSDIFTIWFNFKEGIGFFSLVWLLGFVFSIFVIICSLKDKEKIFFEPKIFLTIFFIFLTFSHFSALFFSKNYANHVISIRHFYLIFLFPVFFLWIFFSKKEKFLFLFLSFLFLFTLGFGIFSFWEKQKMSKSPSLNTPPDKIACIIEKAKNNGVRFGIGNYWIARPVVLYSQSAILLYPVETYMKNLADLEIAYFNSNPSHFVENISKNYFPQFEFFVVHSQYDKKESINRFGKPDKIENCMEMEVWIYQKNKKLAEIAKNEFEFYFLSQQYQPPFHFIRKQKPLSHFASHLELMHSQENKESLQKLSQKKSALLTIKTTNTSLEKWSKNSIYYSYKWLDKKTQKIVIPEGLRSILFSDVYPQEERESKIAISPPYLSGEYILRISLVQKSVGWFEEKGGGFLDIEIKIE